ncbi:MAG: peptidyl-prolyl cis-trans isomerase [Deltaproteobacteria bacterium]|nr:peptidyl-prolyl cis-trans isomerase [Deltaproteobacteria bacterium]
MINTKPHSNIISPVSKSRGMFLIFYGVSFLLALSFVAACDKINIFSRPYVATVNGSKIYLEDYQRRLDQKMSLLPKDFVGEPDNMKRFEEEVLDGIITEKIMDLRAQELNISVSETELEGKIKEFKKDYGEDFTGLLAQENVKYEQWKEEFKKERVLQKLVAIDVNAKIKISENEAEDYFNEHLANYKTESRVRVAQIVVRDLEMAKKVETRLKAGEDFASVATKVSIGPEASRGGDLGFITRWIMPEPLDKTIFSLPVNKVSPIVQSSYGFHIFKVLESQPAKTQNFSDVKEEVIADIRLQKEEAAFLNWLEELKKKAVIKKETNIKIKKPNK